MQDFDEEGHIRSAINIPSTTFEDQVDAVIDGFCVGKVDKVIVHWCAH